MNEVRWKKTGTSVLIQNEKIPTLLLDICGNH